LATGLLQKSVFLKSFFLIETVKMYHASLWHFEGLFSPGSCFIEAYDTRQGVIEALREGR
jgi:hypothetical protein